MNHEEVVNNVAGTSMVSQIICSNAAAIETESTFKISSRSLAVDDELESSATSPARDVMHRNSSKDNNYCGLQMREQDADWLEAMHINGGPNKTGMTPVLTSTSLRSIYGTTTNDPSELPPTFSLLTDIVVDSENATSIRTGPQSPTVKNRNMLLPYLPNNSPKIKTALQTNDDNDSAECHDTVMTVIEVSESHTTRGQEMTQDLINTTSFRNSRVQNSEESTTSTPVPPPRRSILMSDRPVLSGTIYEDGNTVSMLAVNASDVDDKGNVPLQAMTSREAFASGSDHSILARKQRDGYKSDDEDGNTADAKERRKNTEVAQFVDAVGDNALDVQIIEDDDDDQGDAAHSDDDDDDDATEIHIHEQQRNVVGGLLPIKVIRSSVVSIPNPIAALAKSKSTAVVARNNSSSVPPNDATGTIPIADEFPETPVKARPPHSQAFMTTMETTATSLSSPNNSSSPSRNGFLAQLPTSDSMCASHDFVYKGIGANPPEIVKRGTTRGNYAQLHRKAWLEVTDKYHRYGKNLRLYYRYWENEGHPTNIFFDWLDSKGDAAGNELPELTDCPRRQLDSDTVLYINNPDVTQGYAIHVVVEEIDANHHSSSSNTTSTDRIRRGCMYDVDGHPVCTGPEGWIFVLRDNIMYGAKKITSVSGQSRQRFHHSSFFGGKAVAAAGIFITDDDGYLTRLYPHSGHYRPGEAHMQRVLFYLYHEGVDLRSFEMDTQQIMHVARDGIETTKDKKNNVKDVVTTEKKKKVEALHLLSAVYIACFLAHKARFIGEGIFAQIHRIRQSDVASVSEALAVIDHGGFWRKEK